MIEILIALAVIAILGSLAYPSYRDKIVSSRRAEAKAALSDLANRLEAHYAKTNTYVTATIGTGGATDVLENATTPSGYYSLMIESATASTYRIMATPLGTQLSGDTKCQALRLTSANVKTVTGPGPASSCW
jgi:type IV pilus assembly protein PilE